MPRLKLEINTGIALSTLLELILQQWDEEQIFELVKELDAELASFTFTEKMRDLFDEAYNLDLVEKAEDVALQNHEQDEEA
jgi:hypothetical protein